MNLLVPSLPVTPDDLLKRADGNRFELVNGRPVETDMSFWTSYVAGQMLFLIGDYLRTNPIGWMVPEGTTYQCFPSHPTQVRKPDVSFMLLARYSVAQAQQEGHCRVAPDLAVEVISPNDLIVDLHQKLLEYLDAGIPLIWVIDPQARIVWVLFRSSIRLLRETDELSGEDVLPGFHCPIAQLFVPPSGLPATGPSQP
jgi:Uma2 family endonuclease